MAQVTVELGQLITRTNFELFDFPYQFDDLSFKTQLEQTIIDFYYDYEIGFETPDMFKRKFKARFTRDITYFNKLYNTTLLQYNPLINSKMSEALEQLSTTASQQDSELTNTSNGKTTNIGTSTINQDIVGNTSDDSTTTNNLSTKTTGNEKASDYPQQSIAGGDYLQGERATDNTTTNTGTVKNASTGTNDSHTEGNTTNDDETTSNNTTTNTGIVTDTGTNNTNYTKTIEGLTGTTYQELISQERSNIMRIQNMIIEELKPCFILVF